MSVDEYEIMYDKLDRIITSLENNINLIEEKLKSTENDRDMAYNRIYELEEAVDRWADERKELLEKIYSLQDEINNKDRFSNFRDI